MNSPSVPRPWGTLRAVVAVGHCGKNAVVVLSRELFAPVLLAVVDDVGSKPGKGAVSEEVAATVSAPRALAIWIAAEPTPPEPPSTSTFDPGPTGWAACLVNV